MKSESHSLSVTELDKILEGNLLLMDLLMLVF